MRTFIVSVCIAVLFSIVSPLACAGEPKQHEVPGQVIEGWSGLGELVEEIYASNTATDQLCRGPQRPQTIMTAVDLKKQINAVMEAAEQSPDPEVRAAVGVLATLQGTLVMQNTGYFFETRVAPFAEEQVRLLKDLQKQRDNPPRTEVNVKGT